MNNTFTKLQRSIIDSLASIEKSDQEACDGCGGEDCQCCEIYIDRQAWVSADDLFAEGGY